MGGNFDEHLNRILSSLTDNDISIRKRSLDLLFLMAGEDTAGRIVDELLGYLESCADPKIKDELVLKVAILAERFAQNQIWYVDVIVRLLSSAGDYVTDDIWYRIVQLITGFGKYNTDLQSYATHKLFGAMMLAHVNENLLKIGCFVLSEFMDQSPLCTRHPERLVDTLYKHFSGHGNIAKKMVLNAIAKVAARSPVASPKVQLLLQSAFEDHNPDVQQRAVEYFVLLSEDEAAAAKVLEKSPPFSEEQQQYNPLLKRLAGNKGKSLSDSKEEDSKAKLQASTINTHFLSSHPLYQAAKTRLCHSRCLPTPARLEFSDDLRDNLAVTEGECRGFKFQQKIGKGVVEMLVTVTALN